MSKKTRKPPSGGMSATKKVAVLLQENARLREAAGQLLSQAEAKYQFMERRARAWKALAKKRGAQ